ncbi:sugar kinase [Endozoicomonadaceae bacterium StTr2]
MTIKVACIGECMAELSETEGDRCTLSMGGDTYNTAVYLKRCLGSRADVSFISALGADGLSNRMLKQWQAEGLNCDLVTQITDKQPGLYSIQLTPEGERSFCYWRNDSAARSLFSRGLDLKQLETLQASFDLYFISSISLAILDPASRKLLVYLMAQAHQRGATIAFDSNYRPMLWESEATARHWINEVLQFVDIALVSFDDEKKLFGDKKIEQTLSRLETTKEVVVKKGENGCHLGGTLTKSSTVPAEQVKEVLDTTAAGDAFNGAYLAARMMNQSPLQAARNGNQLAAKVICHKGAIIPAEQMQ